jgi:hypothetical protein
MPNQPRFTIRGRFVDHNNYPRCTVCVDCDLVGSVDVWLDPPPESDESVRTIIDDAVCFYRNHCRDDWIQASVAKEMDVQGLTSTDVEELSGGAVPASHIDRYRNRKASMGSHKLQHILRVLGLSIVRELLIRAANKPARRR